MAYTMLSPEGAKCLRASEFYMPSRPKTHVLISIAPVALIMHIINMLILMHCYTMGRVIIHC